MYLHYYLNQKYVGVVDIEVFFDAKNDKALISCSAECANLLTGLELVYGKKIPTFTRGEAWDLQHGHSRNNPYSKSVMPRHVFTTKKCGPVLTWDEYERVLACRL